MADPERDSTHLVELYARLSDEAHRFGFFQVLRQIDCAHADTPGFGNSKRLAEDPIRLAQDPSLAFAPATLTALQDPEGERPARLLQRFFGLFGPNGPLPLHLTEYAYDRQHNHSDDTFVHFADVFHHRMLSLFYRAWAVAQPTVSRDNADVDRFSVYVGALFGLGMDELRNRDHVEDDAKLYSAGRFVLQTRNAEGLLAVIQSYFQLPVQLKEFVGRWIRIPEPCRCRLGGPSTTASLGITTTVGSRIWDCQQTYRLVMGPMTYEQYLRFLPGGDDLPRLFDLARLYTGDELACDVHLVLQRDEVPELQLGRSGQLGWTTWLKSRPLERSADDLHLHQSLEVA